jgi:hypothetical protein
MCIIAAIVAVQLHSKNTVITLGIYFSATGMDLSFANLKKNVLEPLEQGESFFSMFKKSTGRRQVSLSVKLFM